MNVSKTQLKKLQNFLSDLGYTLRYEKGHFRSGFCVMKDQKIILINKFFDRQGRYYKLIQILSSLNIDKESLETDLQKKYDSYIKELEIPITE